MAITGQGWAVDAQGGFLGADKLSKELRHAAQPIQKFRQFVNAEAAVGVKRNDTYLFDKISNISVAGGALNETVAIPKANYAITQGSLVCTEYGNAIPFTMKLDKLAEMDVPESIKVVLRNDMAKVLDSAAAAQFVAADYKAVIIDEATTTITSDGVATATSSASISDKNARDIIDKLKTTNVPRYDGSDYVAICSTSSIRGLYDFFEAKATQTTMKNAASGEIGGYYGCRFVEETNFLSNVLGDGSDNGEAVFFGGDAVREGIVIPGNIRVDVPTDFGRSQGIAWYYLGGFVKTWDFTADGESRIIHVTSA